MPIQGLCLTEQGACISETTEATIALGKLLGSLLAPGDVLVLTGDLGAGKTQLTKGIAQGVGATTPVTSPTFTIQMAHQGCDFPLYHFDLYRLNSPEQLGDCGLWDVLGYDGPCIIEWGEQFSDYLGEERLDIVLTRMESDANNQEPKRQITFCAHDERSQEIIDSLMQKLRAEL